MTADGIPFIDRSPRFQNVWIAAGHSMLGISMGTGTGKLVAELITNRKPHLDPTPYRLNR
jgi:D-amino-acid dehydrogenase